MAIKKIAPGLPQRIIEKINEIIGGINSMDGDISTAEGDITDIQGDVTDIQGDITDIQGDITTIQGNVTTAQGDITSLGTRVTALENASGGGGTAILRCDLTYTGEGTEGSPYVGHLDHASEILDALDHESSYDPIIVIGWDFGGQQGQCLPAIAEYRIETFQGAQFEMEYLNAYGTATSQGSIVSLNFMFAIDHSGTDPMYIVSDPISQITTQNATIADNVISFTAPQQ